MHRGRDCYDILCFSSREVNCNFFGTKLALFNGDSGRSGPPPDQRQPPSSAGECGENSSDFSAALHTLGNKPSEWYVMLTGHVCACGRSGEWCRKCVFTSLYCLGLPLRLLDDRWPQPGVFADPEQLLYLGPLLGQLCGHRYRCL
jgi:hypothetical protein